MTATTNSKKKNIRGERNFTKIAFLLGCGFFLFSSNTAQASSLEVCGQKYLKKSAFLHKFAFNQGAANLTTAGIIEITTGAALAGYTFPLSYPVAMFYEAKATNHERLGSSILVAAQSEEVDEFDSMNFDDFRDDVNKPLIREEEVDEEELSAMVKGLVANGSICQGVERIVKKEKKKKNGEIKRKIKYTGWIMKPKKVKKLIRRMARAKAAREANGEEVVEISTLINELPNHN